MAMNLKEILESAAHLQKECAKAYESGVKYALDYIVEELGLDITDSDIYEEYMNEEAN